MFPRTIALLLILAVVTAKDLPESAKRAFLKAAKGCTPDNVLEALNKDQYIPIEQLQNAYICVLKKINFIDDSGNIKENVIKKHWSKIYGESEWPKLKKCLVKQETAGQTCLGLLNCQFTTSGIPENAFMVE
ncbi:uncharacterized protein LOC109604992 [Aethina tumida]|uniref:uncharacterized protein LOC109604992 n=1 Tax=Aethina tumida TaxID=116153 RepID=UPI00096ADFB7|nr:uncharacterized protein LOC109604992 [Aethina tumida]